MLAKGLTITGPQLLLSVSIGIINTEVLFGGIAFYKTEFAGTKKIITKFIEYHSYALYHSVL